MSRALFLNCKKSGLFGARKNVICLVGTLPFPFDVLNFGTARKPQQESAIQKVCPVLALVEMNALFLAEIRCQLQSC